TALVGKLDLFTKGLHFELDREQSNKLAAKLAELDQAEQLTGDEAQANLDALDGILTEEQQATLSAIDLPRAGRPGGGGGSPGPGGGGMGGMGGMPTMAAMPGMAGGGASSGASDENPFRQEANQQRLRDLIDRLQPSASESA